jgi:hypothetical protein
MAMTFSRSSALATCVRAIVLGSTAVPISVDAPNSEGLDRRYHAVTSYASVLASTGDDSENPSAPTSDIQIGGMHA